LLLDRISVGGMAEVFKAKSYGVEGFEKIIAIKRILPTMGEDRDFIKMFIDEAKIAGQLAHANICQIFELGRIDGSHFIAMEYIWGKDLLQIQNRLRKLKAPMPIAMACFVIAKVLEGLDYAHRKRDALGRPLEIVHRDCSPQNVLVSYEGEVKVIDFGIAKATSRNSRTMAGVLKGKFGYMSPEQVRGLPLDRRSDLFALGTMLYECLAGDRLFQGETDFSTLEKVRNVDVRPPREINPNIPVAVEAVIMKALAKDVEDRYQWCSEMLADLQTFLMSQDVVFTAKSLSSWLKDVFSGEIERERQQLEQYKRVGRDGLFAGLPAAEAKVDVVETLGEAGSAEGDPTVLGGPSFEDIEQAAGAAPEVGPAPGSPALAVAEANEDSNEDFGEEAPTEIFGEIDHGANPAAARAPSAPSGAQPVTRPPKPPPNRAPTSRGDLPALFAPASAVPGASSGRTPPPATGEPGAPSYSPSQMAAPAPQVVPASSQPIAVPNGAMSVPPQFQPNGQPPVNPGQGRTLIGQPAPTGLPNYAQGYPPGPYPGQPGPQQLAPAGAPGQTPAPQFGRPSSQMAMPQLGPQGQTMMPQLGPQMPQGPMMPMQMHPPVPGYPGGNYPPQPFGPGGPYGPPNQLYAPNPPYGANQFHPPAPAVEPGAPEGRKRSSIARDVAIGVAIAALVLGGFLAVKFLILDSDSPTAEPAAPASPFAKVQPALPAGESANLFVDEVKKATVRDHQIFEVSAGVHKLKLVSASGTVCEQNDVKLEAGKTFLLQCAQGVAAPATGSGSAGSAGPGSAAVAPAGSGSAGDTASGSAAAGSAAGSATGSGATTSTGTGTGSAAGSAAKTDATERPVPDKTDRMPVEDTAKPADHGRPARVKPPERPADRPSDKARPAERARSTGDDDLGVLQGGVKPGEKKGKRRP
jgi:serine/threonine protein kinase